MAALTITGLMKEVLERFTTEESSVLTTDEKALVSQSLINGQLAMQSVPLLKKCLDADNAARKDTSSKISLRECIRGSQASIIVPKKEGAKGDGPKPDPALLKRREFLQLEREKKEYNRMVFGSDVYVFCLSFVMLALQSMLSHIWM